MCRRARHVRPTDTSAANYWEKTKSKENKEVFTSKWKPVKIYIQHIAASCAICFNFSHWSDCNISVDSFIPCLA